MPLFSQPPKSICILRLSAIGDVCHALAVVQAIQRYWPETKITWIIGKVERQLFAQVEGINFVVYDKKAGIKGILALWKQLKGQRFDALLNMQTALRASILSLGIKAKYKIGFGKVRSREGQQWVVNRRIQDPENPHVLNGFIAFAEMLGVPVSQLTWHLNIPESTQQKMAQHIDTNRQTLIIAPCSSKAEKDWLPERYADIANLAHAQNKQVILCGANSAREQQMLADIEKACNFKPLNLAGKTSLLELAALIQQADLVLAPDSGPAHIATAVGTPVIGLYAYHNPKRTGPYNDLDKVISVYDDFLAKEQPQAKKLPWAYKLKTPHLMENITSEQVIAKMREIGFLV